MDIVSTFFDGVRLVIGLLLISVSFIARTMVWGRMLGGKSEKIAWFGRMFMFLGGSVLVYESGLAILQQLHVAVDPSWHDIGLPLAEAVLLVLFLPLVVRFLIVTARGLKGKEETRTERIISILLSLIFLYLASVTTPAIVRRVVTLFR